ncbi:hypothetical protein EON83_20830 [bacterium]|nr:MAG: hypothetical protein EON83_20830 [bacterium]
MEFQSSRTISASPSSVFAAFADSERLAVWWGPDGFTSTFATYEFEPDGKWSFVMHGPDGKDYNNEIVIKEIEPSRRIVIRHVSQPHYLLEITFEPTVDGGTLVGWNQDFENPETARLLKHIVVPANEQLLNRLNAEVLSKQSN